MGAEPISYTIFFENKPEATAPAQDVVITDQLDTSKFDLSTFSLGPITFGDEIVTPPPGLSEWTTDVNLQPPDGNPDDDLIVRIDAELDEDTGIITWSFATLVKSTEEPLAGFLPPNDDPPEGSVLFNVLPKPELTTGTEIRNDARIVFDTNAPMDTPEWLNTIDETAPAVSRVKSPKKRSSNVMATFNEPIDCEDALNLGFEVELLKNDAATPVGGTISCSEDGKTAIFDPEGKLPKKSTFRATVKAKDLAGNESAAKTWKFKTKKK